MYPCWLHRRCKTPLNNSFMVEMEVNMPSRCDFYSDEEYEYAVQMEIEAYREQLEYEEEFAKYCEEEYIKEQELF